MTPGKRCRKALDFTFELSNNLDLRRIEGVDPPLQFSHIVHCYRATCALQTARHLLETREPCLCFLFDNGWQRLTSQTSRCTRATKVQGLDLWGKEVIPCGDENFEKIQIYFYYVYDQRLRAYMKHMETSMTTSTIWTTCQHLANIAIKWANIWHAFCINQIWYIFKSNHAILLANRSRVLAKCWLLNCAKIRKSRG